MRPEWLETPLETEKLLAPTFRWWADLSDGDESGYTMPDSLWTNRTDVFPVGKTTADELNAALVHLTTADREARMEAHSRNSRKKFHC